MEAEILEALRRLYAGDASASQALEAFQCSPNAMAVASELLRSSAPEVQFFAASTIHRLVAHAQDKQALNYEWLLQEALRVSPAARRELLAALATAAGAPLAPKALSFLSQEATWSIGVELLLALPPPWPQLSGVCAQLSPWFGRGHDERLLLCALRFPDGIADTPVSQHLESAVSAGKIFEIPEAASLPGPLCQCLFRAALAALSRGHLDAAASVLSDLPPCGLDLLEPAEFLLKAPVVSTRLAGVELWSRLVQQLGETKDPRFDMAFARFRECFFPAAEWVDGEDPEPLREALWSLVVAWQLASPKRVTLVEPAFEELGRVLTTGGCWQRAEAALWLLAKYAKGGKKEEVQKASQAPLLIFTKLQNLHESVLLPLEPLVISSCALVEAIPSAEAAPFLLELRLAQPQARKALRSVCASCRSALMGTDLARTLQRRALEGEDDLVASAAQLQDADGVRQLAQHWAKLCLEASPSQLPQRARAVFASMTRADICLLLMPDCAHFLRFVDREEQVLFAVRVAEFASTSQHLRAPALEVWIAVWPQAEGDEDLVAALEQLVQSTARTSDLAAPALTLLVKSFANATSWAPHCVNAALGAVEASIAPASSPWPLTVAMATAYGYVIQCAATIASCQPLPSALSLVGALASWSDNTDLGRALRAALLGNEAAVRGLVAQSEDTRTTQRIVRALGL